MRQLFSRQSRHKKLSAYAIQATGTLSYLQDYDLQIAIPHSACWFLGTPSADNQPHHPALCPGTRSLIVCLRSSPGLPALRSNTIAPCQWMLYPLHCVGCSIAASVQNQHYTGYMHGVARPTEKHFCSLKKPCNMFHHVRPKALE